MADLPEDPWVGVPLANDGRPLVCDEEDRMPDYERLNCLEKLRDAAYKMFNDRRGYEWKFSLSIWTAEAILLAGLFQPTGEKSFPLAGSWAGPLALAVAIILVVCHTVFTHGFAIANDVNKQTEQTLRDKMREELNIPLSEGEKTAIKRLPSHPRVGWMSWSHLSQLMITALLAAVAVLFVFARAS